MFRRIRDLREDRDLTQKELAEVLFVRQQTYSDYERGRLDIPTEALLRLSRFYGVSIDYLLEATDEMIPGSEGEQKTQIPTDEKAPQPESEPGNPEVTIKPNASSYAKLLSDFEKLSHEDKLLAAEAISSALKGAK